MIKKSLKSRKDDLSDTQRQLAFLSNGIFGEKGKLSSFKEKIKKHNLKLHPKTLEVFQMNLGYMCNQVCAHCHVDAGPDRKEMMSDAILKKCFEIIKENNIATVDLTGGAPEMHPKFRQFVEMVSPLGIKDFIVRSNLTILLANKKFFDLPDFFAKHNIHIISSLPFYKKEKTDRQRGEGVFNTSIKALQKLNKVGYGLENSPLKLDLVYNPAGAFLPSNQSDLESNFKKALKEDFGIEFHNLFTITNLPISRFLEYLIASENYEEYMETLVNAFNPSAVENLMCRNTLSVSWDGFLYDCDFNQMLNMKVKSKHNHISNFNNKELKNRKISIHQHCYGCTAGAGSSCQGSIA